MKTWTQYLSLYKTLTKNTSVENETLGGQNINDSIRTIASIRNGKWKWLEVLEVIQSVGGKESYSIPNNIRKMSDIWTRVGGGNPRPLYIPTVIYDPYKWKWVLSSMLGSSDITRFVYIQDDTLELNPIPQTDGIDIYLRGRKDLRDMSIADYTAGNITTAIYTQTLTGSLAVGATSATLTSNWSLPSGEYQVTFDSDEIRIATFTNGSSSFTWTTPLDEITGTDIIVGSETGGSIIIGTGTTWTVPMAKRYIRITDSSTANKGDGFWYEIEQVYSTTALSLTKVYQGLPIVAGTAAYTIGQISPIPEAYDMAPLWRAVAMYWDIQADPIAKTYWRLYDGGKEAGLVPADAEYGGLIGQMLEESGSTQEGPYISPNDYGNWTRDPNNPEPDVPQQAFI